MTDLAERLMAIQAAHGWNQKEMASRIGVTPGMWAHVVNGRSRIGPRTALRVLRAFPELERDVLAHLRAGDVAA